MAARLSTIDLGMEQTDGHTQTDRQTDIRSNP